MKKIDSFYLDVIALILFIFYQIGFVAIMLLLDYSNILLVVCICLEFAGGYLIMFLLFISMRRKFKEYEQLDESN